MVKKNLFWAKSPSHRAPPHTSLWYLERCKLFWWR